MTFDCASYSWCQEMVNSNLAVSLGDHWGALSAGASTMAASVIQHLPDAPCNSFDNCKSSVKGAATSLFDSLSEASLAGIEKTMNISLSTLNMISNHFKTNYTQLQMGFIML